LEKGITNSLDHPLSFNHTHSKMRFSYDAEHQMQTAQIYKNGREQTVHYAYDPFGRRIAKTDTFNTTHFIWDGNRLLTELRGKQSNTLLLC
jgi:YD repeat-containing protein